MGLSNCNGALLWHPFPFGPYNYFLRRPTPIVSLRFFFLSLEYDKDSKLLLWHESQAIAVTNSNTYSDPLIQWVSVKRSLRCVNNIYFQDKTDGRKEINGVSFFATIVNNNWHFYSTKTSLRAGSQWFEVHEGPVLSAAVSQLLATSSYYNNTTIALSQI